jgi:hypothetical protein
MIDHPSPTAYGTRIRLEFPAAPTMDVRGVVRDLMITSVDFTMATTTQPGINFSLLAAKHRRQRYRDLLCGCSSKAETPFGKPQTTP